MKKVVALLVVLTILGLLAGCSSKRVVFDFSETADFTQYRTFQYKPTDSTVEASNQLVHNRILEGIRRELTAAGLTEVDEDPDVFVSYYGSTSQEIRLNTTYMGYSSWHSRHRHGMGMTTSTTTATTITTGSLVIDIWDAREKVLVWRGEVSDSLSGDPGRDADRLNRAIASVLANFPPK